MTMKDYEGKQVYVKLNSGRVYSGKIIEVNFLGTNPQGCEMFLFIMIDKFGAKISFSNTELNLLEEEK